MKAFYLIIICIFGYSPIVFTQVIYERVFSPVYPSIEHAFQLSDLSTVSFANNSQCNSAAYLHIDKQGVKISSGGISSGSTHSLGVRPIGWDEILVWFREGPDDYDGPNYFKIGLWMHDEFVTLVRDTSLFNIWEDSEIVYEAYLFQNDKIVYRKGDSLYLVQVSTQQLLNKVAIPEFSIVHPFLDYIVVFDYVGKPVVFSIDLDEVAYWNNNQHPVSSYESMALDSFLIGIITQEDATLHVVNGLTEESFDLDLSGYLTHIEDIQVNTDGLFVKGKKDDVDYLVQLNWQFQVFNETVVDLPDIPGPFTYTYYTDRMYAWKADGLSAYRANYRISYQYPDSNPIRFVDISLDTIWVDSIYYWPPEMHLPAKLFLLARVTNHSKETVRSFTLHFESTQTIQCDPGIYYGIIEGLSILPGETEIIPVSTWSWEVAENEPFFRTYFIQHANNHLDSNWVDNYFQFSYLLSAIHPVIEINLSIWPNPFHDYLETSEDFERLRMYNSLGHVVSTGINRLDNLASLVPGTYYVQALKDKKSFFTRVIKVE